MRKLTKLIVGAAVAATVATVQAQITLVPEKLVYIDATDTADGNTMTFTNAEWTVWNAVTGQTWAPNDGIWDRREFANPNTIPPIIYGTTRTIYQNAASGQVDPFATRLRTTVTLPLAGGDWYYEVYALYWSDPTGWRIAASLTDDPVLPLYIHGQGMSSVQFWPNGPGGEHDHPDVGTRWSHELSPNPFTTSVMVSEGNRRLLMTPSLGTVTGGTISVYIGPDPSQQNSNERTWYDGIAVRLVPEPGTWALLGMAALLLTFKLRRRV